MEHSEPDSPSERAGDGDGDKQIVTGEGFLNITRFALGLDSSLIVLVDSLRIRWMTVA